MQEGDGCGVELRSLVDLSEDGRVAESALEELLLAQEVPTLVIALELRENQVDGLLFIEFGAC